MKQDFLFGSSVVLGALKSSRRRLFKLHLSSSLQNQPQGGSPVIRNIVELAKQKNVKIVNTSVNLLDNWSKGRPHQGLVLEAGPLHVEKAIFVDFLDSVRVHATENEYREHPLPVHRSYPVVLALDQVVDPQNLGAILRTSLFLGVDAIVLTEKETAPLSPFVSKASAGALEIMENVYATKNLPKFIKSSEERGWTSIGTDISSSGNIISSSELIKETDSGPLILVLGNEGQGLRKNVAAMCKKHVLIPSKSPHSLVDSLNVSVAAGILLSEIC